MVALPNHSHCKYCGNPTPYGEEYCDEDCKALYKAEESVERRKDIIFYAAIAISLVAILAVGAVLRMVH